jgi:hypothetical protein
MTSENNKARGNSPLLGNGSMNKSELQLAHDATTEEFQIMFSAHHIS